MIRKDRFTAEQTQKIKEHFKEAPKSKWFILLTPGKVSYFGFTESSQIIGILHMMILDFHIKEWEKMKEQVASLKNKGTEK